MPPQAEAEDQSLIQLLKMRYKLRQIIHSGRHEVQCRRYGCTTLAHGLSAPQEILQLEESVVSHIKLDENAFDAQTLKMLGACT